MIPITAVQTDALIAAAKDVWSRAYAPYSNFPVGAAVLGADGKIYTGVNIENASYGLTVCAERNAIGQMITAVGEQQIAAVAVTSKNGVPPCGACRQVLIEFAGDVPVWLVDMTTEDVGQTSLHQLMPHFFDATQLPENEDDTAV